MMRRVWYLSDGRVMVSQAKDMDRVRASLLDRGLITPETEWYDCSEEEWAVMEPPRATRDQWRRPTSRDTKPQGVQVGTRYYDGRTRPEATRAGGEHHG